MLKPSWQRTEKELALVRDISSLFYYGVFVSQLKAELKQRTIKHCIYYSLPEHGYSRSVLAIGQYVKEFGNLSVYEEYWHIFMHELILSLKHGIQHHDYTAANQLVAC
jgi:hypothetical protein